MHAVAPPPKDPLTDPAPWNAIAADYDQVWFERLPELMDQAIELLSLESGDRVLDVAAGPGTLAVRLAPRVGHVMAIDFAETMIERLRGHIMRSRLPNLEARLMNGQELEFDDSSFDAAVSMFGLDLFDDRTRGLAEMFRVVVPGGRVLLSSWAPNQRNALIGAGEAALQQALPELPRPREPEQGELPELLETELDAAGFEQVTTRMFERALRFASVADYWQGFERASAPVLLLKQQLGQDIYAAAVERAQASLVASWGEGAFELLCSARLTSAERPLSAA